ncbi:hypothetical protein [Lunatimonas salinarum]|uniref:hypothetical protein n=1 Tax=Lunatimonas salinarum TaxID=1774590 RepID=UPI001FD75F4F|nr:hypothetical protein [Lunatimonas salinarum]
MLTEIRHEYGRVLADAGYRYQYYLTDHIGNTRVVLQEDPANFTVSATFEPDNLETESMQRQPTRMGLTGSMNDYIRR